MSSTKTTSITQSEKALAALSPSAREALLAAAAIQVAIVPGGNKLTESEKALRIKSIIDQWAQTVTATGSSTGVSTGASGKLSFKGLPEDQKKAVLEAITVKEKANPDYANMTPEAKSKYFNQLVADWENGQWTLDGQQSYDDGSLANLGDIIDQGKKIANVLREDLRKTGNNQASVGGSMNGSQSDRSFPELVLALRTAAEIAGYLSQARTGGITNVQQLNVGGFFDDLEFIYRNRAEIIRHSPDLLHLITGADLLANQGFTCNQASVGGSKDNQQQIDRVLSGLESVLKMAAKIAPLAADLSKPSVGGVMDGKQLAISSFFDDINKTIDMGAEVLDLFFRHGRTSSVSGATSSNQASGSNDGQQPNVGGFFLFDDIKEVVDKGKILFDNRDVILHGDGPRAASTGVGNNQASVNTGLNGQQVGYYHWMGRLEYDDSDFSPEERKLMKKFMDDLEKRRNLMQVGHLIYPGVFSETA